MVLLNCVDTILRTVAAADVDVVAVAGGMHLAVEGVVDVGAAAG